MKLSRCFINFHLIPSIAGVSVLIRDVCGAFLAIRLIIDGSPVGAEHACMKKDFTFHHTFEALACVIVGEVVCCSYSTRGWVFTSSRMIPELMPFVALGCIVEFKVGDDLEVGPKYQASLEGVSNAVPVHDGEWCGGNLFSISWFGTGMYPGCVVEDGMKLVLRYFLAYLGEVLTSGGHGGRDVVEDDMENRVIVLEVGGGGDDSVHCYRKYVLRITARVGGGRVICYERNFAGGGDLCFRNHSIWKGFLDVVAEDERCESPRVGDVIIC